MYIRVNFRFISEVTVSAPVESAMVRLALSTCILLVVSRAVLWANKLIDWLICFNLCLPVCCWSDSNCSLSLARLALYTCFCTIFGPILWGHSGPLCHALSLSSSSSSSLWTSMRRRRATVQWRHLVKWREAARCGEWAQHFSNASGFVNVYMIAYCVHVYTRASLTHSPNPNPNSSNRISLKTNLFERLA